MNIILGGTGHIGTALAETLLQRHEPVTVVTRDEAKRRTWEQKGAEVAIADVLDVDALHRVLERGRRAFLLNPPAPPDSDTAREEQKSVRAILAALEGCSLDHVLVQSTYGARAGERIGDLGVLYELEQGVQRLPLPSTVIRGAYYMSNWDMSKDSARNDGIVHTFFPEDFALPMVAPEDIGRIAADLLASPEGRQTIHFVEGPARYSSRDVAAAFSNVLGKSVRAVSVPESSWMTTLQGAGFSKRAAESMAAMMRIVLAHDFEMPRQPTRGTTTLETYVRNLLATD